MSEEKQIILKAVEYFLRAGNTDDLSIKITRIPDNKTSYV